MSIIHEIRGDEPASLMSILYASNGFYTGDILFDRPIRPEQGLSDSINQSNETYKLIEENIIHTVVARYSALFNTPMIAITKMFGIERPPTKEEIEHDLDHFGIDQMLWPKDFYAGKTGTSIDEIDPKIPRYNFPKGSFMGDEEYIYTGPMRMEYAQCATFIDRYPLRTSLDYMIETIEDLKRTEEQIGKDKLVTDGGFLVDVMYKGLVNPLRMQRSSPFPGEKPDDVPIHDSSIITPQIIERAYLGLKQYAEKNSEEIKTHLETLKQDFFEKWPHIFHHGPREFKEGFLEIVEDEAKSTEKWYLTFYDRWKQSKSQQEEQK